MYVCAHTCLSLLVLSNLKDAVTTVTPHLQMLAVATQVLSPASVVVSVRETHSCVSTSVPLLYGDRVFEV